MRTSNIVQEAQNSHEVGENAIAMTIDESSAVFLMDALGKLYTRPAQAVLREYLSNAVDAHKAKGGTLPPIQIDLPEGAGAKGYGTLRIRDFGKGMNEEQFGSILSRYGASTKRDSNALIGGFGVGAKSGFALTDEFFMTSYQQGKGLRVRIFKDSLNQGYVEVVERFDTQESDGMLVEIPIPKSNLPELKKFALTTELPFFVGYDAETLDIRPAGVEYGNLSVHNPKSFAALELGGNTIGWLGNRFQHSIKTYALIGKVVYVIDVPHIASLARSNKLSDEVWAALPILTSFRNMKVVEVPIGSVDLPSAREEITYSERSLKTLSAVLSKYVLSVKQHIQTELNKKETRSKALEYLVQLEEDGYPHLDELRWRGQPSLSPFFSKSPIATTHFYSGTYQFHCTTAPKGPKMNYRALLGLSDKNQYHWGIFQIVVDSEADMPSVQNFLQEKVLKSLLNLSDEALKQQPQHALFVVTTKNDPLKDWVFNATSLTVPELHAAAVKAREEEVRKAELAAAANKAEKARKKAEEVAFQARQRAVAESSLSYFTLAGRGKALFYQPAEIVAHDRAGKETYYWSEEEVEKFATVTSGLKKISLGFDKTCLLFPFVPAGRLNSFNTVVETKNNTTTNYLDQLRIFLGLFFKYNYNTVIIIVGKSRSLEKFKTDYPDYKSGVLTVKSEIDKQLADENSKIMSAYNSIGGIKERDKIALHNLTSFVQALDATQKAEINQQVIATAKRFEQTLKVGHISGMADRYLLEVLKAFATHGDIRKNSNPLDAEVTALQAKYPLLMQSSLSTYTPEVVNHFVTYLKLCDEGKF